MDNEITDLNAVDAEWGYVFGADGIMSKKSVKVFLDVSDDTLDRMVGRRQIRKSYDTHTSRPKYCRRSINDYIKNLTEVAPEDCRS